MSNQIKRLEQDKLVSPDGLWCAKQYTIELLRAHPDKVFVFGDNLLRRGTGGQAVVRHEPNAFGVPTKRAPSMQHNSFFSDRDNERQAVLIALRNLYALARKQAVVFPAAGLGTGLAQMPTKSPNVYREMCEVLAEYFGFDQTGGGRDA